jgi:catechol 2,3-dioxygenase-like lactoylglutathione lyase family enzyme
VKTIAGLLLTMLAAGAAPKPAAKFQAVTVGTELKGGYMVGAVDVNGDGKKDLVALAEGLSELLWYENPGWQRHVLVSGRHRMIAFAAADLDGDRIPEIVLSDEFYTTAPRSKGNLLLLTHNGDPRQPWTAKQFDAVPTTHRVRFLSPDGTGQPLLAVIPLANQTAVQPGYADHVPLFVYKPGEWKREVVSEVFQGNLHGANVVDWTGDGRQGLLTACATGLHLVRRQPNGQWTVAPVHPGNAEAWPRAGSSEAVLGHLGKRRMMAAIEPWHGNMVVVYTRQGAGWRRQVLDESLKLGHAIAVGDLNCDGLDEIIAGYRGEGASVYLYSAADTKGTKWTKSVLDAGGMAAGSCVVADLDGDSRPDIACIGDRTANLKVYRNQGN